MRLQISSGQGPAECELAVYKLYKALEKEYSDIKMIASHKSKNTNCYTSIQFTTNEDLSFLEGSVLWIAKSPFRPNHKRKNWYVDVSVLKDAEKMQEYTFSKDEIEVQYFHCRGKGGQNVNKVQTGVRITHIPTNVVVTADEQRSQSQNRSIAMQKLKEELDQRQKRDIDECINAAWKEHGKIVRGNPVRTYTGDKFILRFG